MKRKIFADLHNHTTASDGDFTAGQLIKKAKLLGIKAIGITDHDTIDGLKTAVDEGKKENIQVVAGVEVSIRFKEALFVGTLHLLCYFTPERLLDESFIQDLKSVLSKGRGETLVRERVAEINRCFGPDSSSPLLDQALTYEHIAALSHNASRRHFAMSLEQDFNIKNTDVIHRILGNDSPAYLPSGIDFKTAMDAAKELELFSVLAHPAAGSFPGDGHYKEVLPPVETVERFLPQFLDAGLKGLEVYYPGHTKEHQDLISKWAEHYNLVVTGGSDCHDETGRPPGGAGLEKSEFQRFMKALVS